MKSILKATAVLSSASAVSILMGLVSAKVGALLLGPGGVGYMGLVQGLVGLAAILAGFGVSTGLVRAGAQALAQGDEPELAALRRGAWLLCWTLGGAGALALVVFRAPVSRVMLGGPEHTGAVVVAALALVLNLTTGVQTGLLNAHHRVGALARVGVLSSVCGTSLMMLCVWRWRERGIAPAVLALAVVNWAVAAYYLRGGVPAPRTRPTLADAWRAARALLRFGGPYTASMLVGTGVQMLLPVFVLHALSRDDVGFYRAAVAVSVNYLGFLLTAMAQDYYPRASGASAQPAALNSLINEQLRLVLLLSGPVILGMLALVPYLVPLVYTAQFTPAVALLEWQLIGDIFKFAAWTMSFVILARSGSTAFFGTELFGGASLLGFSWLGVRWLGLEGLGVGFTACAAGYCVLCWLILRRALGLRWTTENKLLFLSLTAAACVIRALPYVGLEVARTPVALALAAAAGLASLYVIWGEFGGLRGLLARRKVA
ncbi:MAG TPA: O-antigen translocase [Pyrinomonadaceae bacterium]